MGRTVAIVQARMGSTRLPGKGMVDLAGCPLVAHVLRRAAAAGGVDAVVLAVPDTPADRPLADWAEGGGERGGWTVFVGSEEDVLARYAGAAAASDAAHIVRITGDCPLLDPGTVAKVVARHHETGADYTANILARTYPRGLDTEVMTRALLDRMVREGTEPADREHVTRWVHRNPGAVRTESVEHDEDLSGWRLCVDEPDDLELVRKIYRRAGPEGPPDLAALVRLLREDPALAETNAHVRQKHV